MLVKIIAIVCYGIGSIAFHYGIVSLGTALSGSENKVKRVSVAALLAAINFIVLLVMIRFSFGVVISWLIMTAVLYAETRIFIKLRHLQALFISMEVCICSLSVELLYRAFFAIITDYPLQYFSNAMDGIELCKAVPVALGYFCAGIILCFYASSQTNSAVKHLFAAAKHLNFFFLNMLLSIMFLVLQVFLYENYDNSFQMKLWGLSSAAYILIGYHFAFRYAVRIATLCYFSTKNRAMEETIENYRREADQLREIVEYDELTGVFTRAVGERLILAKLKKGEPMVVCMIDLDGLKFVNDHYGHKKGDWYITTVCDYLKKVCRHGSDVLCRYGGDEFVIAFSLDDTKEIERRMKMLADTITQLGQEQDLPMRISYGISHTAAGMEFHQILAIADENMYQMKYLHKQEMPNVVRG